mgnify:CR=1 FL=1
MHSLILVAATRFSVALLLVFSVFTLFRGHNEPGGGFIGGLLAAAALSLHGLAFGKSETRRLIRVSPKLIAGAGLGLCTLSGCLALLWGRPFMTGLWMKLAIPGVGKLSSVLLFDIGVYLVVMGTTILMILALAEAPVEEAS